jgi:hypothetical protein
MEAISSRLSLLLRLLAGVSTCIAAGSAHCVGFVINDDVRGAWNNTIAVGAAIRASNPDPQLVGFNNANQYPGAHGAVSSADDGNLNYRKNQVVSAPAVLVSDFEVRYRNDYGVFARARAWYDIQLENHGVPHGNTPNGYVPEARLDDSGFYNSDKFKGIELLDAYVYGNFKLGDAKLTARFGKQTINWGEAQLYGTGILSFNPYNFSALARPGSRLEDALVPVNRIYGNLITKDGLSVEAFYALAWTRSALPGCGTYASPSDPINEPSCNAFTLAAPPPDQTQLANHLFAPLATSADPSRSGQYGLAARYFVDPLKTEFGAYYVRYNSPNPVVGLIKQPASPPTFLNYTVQYPEGVQAFAVSAATGFRNVALTAELSEFLKLPVQRNAPSLIQGVGPSGTGPYHAAIAAAPLGEVVPGYFKANKTQLLLGGRVDVSAVTGLADATLIAETSMQWITNLPGVDQERIGRNANWGQAGFNGVCPADPRNYCPTDGFATRFAWGYRLLAQFSLPRPATGLDLQPIVLWSQDLKGYSVDGSLVQGRWTAGLLFRAVYQQVFFAEVGRAWVRGGTDFDGLRDKGVYVVTAGMRF